MPRKFVPGFEIYWNWYSLPSVFGLFSFWKWHSGRDRYGYSFRVGYLVFVFGKSNNNEQYFDPLDDLLNDEEQSEKLTQFW
ncbi:MAG: hypothetical protein KatS3mg087_0576 [Patescibacteria group bacterium]|nr:MAG: hypothetical protein KatS3mg087_0576 [Patescibacteria group bacterium]